jgi:hypothetical protein
MSSARRHDKHLFHAISLAFVIALALIGAILVQSTGADAKKGSSSASKSKLPSITKVKPVDNVSIGMKLAVTGKNFVKGKKKLVVIFKRDGSKRSFTARGDATSTTKAVVVVPDVGGDLVRTTQTVGGPLDNMFRLRPITKYGAAKGWTNTTISPKVVAQSGATLPKDTSAAGDCDSDGIRNGIDPDDDNDLLVDTIELTIGTNVCLMDTDNDDASDFYEYTVAYQYNGGPTLPYPGLRPYPNPLFAGDAGKDFDGDGLTVHGEYRAWQYTGLMSHFYSDADQDSDNDGKLDGAEDEDMDLLPNLTELIDFQGERDLNWLKPDTDGDGLCDGLDDQDHDGPPTPIANADCTSPVPNNGPTPSGGLPPTLTADSFPGGDPNGKIDGDDNLYSNFYEWYNSSAQIGEETDPYNPCMPSDYPVSPYCPGPFNPFPTG